MKNYGIEVDLNGDQTDFFGYYTEDNNTKRIYVCQAYTEEACKEMLNKIKKRNNKKNYYLVYLGSSSFFVLN